MQESRAARRSSVADPAPAGRRGHLPAGPSPAAAGAAVRRAGATLCVAALLAYVALTPLAPFAADTYANELRRHLVLGGVIGAYLIALACTRRLPAPTALDVPLVAALAALAVGVVASLDRRVSLEAALAVLPVVPLSYLLADRRLVEDAALHRGIRLAGAVVATFALASVWRQWRDWLELVRAVEGGVTPATLFPPSVPRVQGVGSHPNVIGAVLALVAPVFVPAIMGYGRWPSRRPARDARADEPPACPDTPPFPRRWVSAAEKGVNALGLLLVLAALFFTLSRAAWAAAAVGLAVTALGLLLAGGWRPRHPRRWAAAAVAAAALLLVVAALLGRARPDWLFRDSLDPRADMRRVGVEVFLARPLTGAGPGLYAALYAEHEGRHPFAAVHSHNLAVQIAADCGLAGLIGAGVLLAAAALLLLRQFRRRGPDGWGVVAAAVATGSLASFLVFGLADAPQLFPESLLVLAAAALPAVRAAPVPTAAFRVPLARVRAWLPALIVVAVVAVLVPAWWRGDRAAAAHQRSVRAVPAGHHDAAVAAARAAVQRDPGMAAYQFQLGAALGARYRERGDTADRADAIRALERGLALEPRIGAAWVDLAALRLDAGDRAGARAAAERLRPLAGRDTLLALAYAVLVQHTGTPDEAIETYAGLLALNPTLAQTAFWQDDAFRAANVDRIVARALARAEEITGPGRADGLRRAIRLLAGRDAPGEDELRAALAAAPEDLSLRVALGRLLLAAGRRAEAEPLLREAVARTGDAAAARAALGDWYAAGGDLPRARREWLAAAWLGDVGAGDALGESFAPVPPAAVVRLQGRLVDGVWARQFYLAFQTFRFTFRRHEPVPIIAPGDWLDALPAEYPRWQAHLERWRGR
jgi:tetratricopeptide (TPR) repeat protein